MREQVCKYMCPYARFQSAMFDHDTLIISYDEHRGEPRGKRKRGSDPAKLGLGHCIDCTVCVQVCPTGIDIREGLQYECIACAACIDACDDVMDKVGYPRGLVKYTTQRSMEQQTPHVVRPRIVVYGLLLLALVSSFAIAVGNRTPLLMDIIRDRNALYRMTSEGEVENVYTLKIMNMDGQTHSFHLSVEGIEGIELDIDDEEITVTSGEVATLAARVQVPESSVTQSGNSITLTLQALDEPSLRVQEHARFIAPAPRR
jgi:cytochrome c oxidase accessory protein FixG